MPRATDSKTMGPHFYHSQFPTASPYGLPSISSQSTMPINPSASNSTPQPSPDTTNKKKHVCPTCDRAFTTSGHLARHSRVHTGERNHKCPFPGCETRCSRQDNLQQHYRIHLSPGSRRSSTRSAIARAMSNNVVSPVYGKRSSASYSPASSHEPPPLSSPPSLEVANRAYSMSTPPDSPPPLAHATLPAATHRPPMDSHSHHSHSRSSSSPELPYSPHNQPQPHSHSHSHSHSHLVGMTNMNGHVASSYPYRSGTATYQEQSQGTFTYVHTTPIPHSSGPGGNLNGHGMHANSFPYPSSHGYDNIHQSPHHTPSPPLSAMSSRHSISHISHPHSHSNGQRSSGGPPSPESTNSGASHNSHTTSGPATPAYPPPPYNDGHHYGVAMESSPELPSLNGSHVNSHGHLVHPGYPSLMQQQNSVPSNRFASPPPILAPIYGDRDNGNGTGSARGDQHQRMPPYVHHSQTISNDYQYSQAQMGSGHPTWKSDSGMRNKGIGALIL